MAKKKVKIGVVEAKEETKEPSVAVAPPERKRKLMQWFIAAGILCATFAFFATRQSGEELDPTLTTPPSAEDTSGGQDVLAQEMSGDLPAAPSEEPMPIPPPVTAETADMEASAPPPPPPPSEAVIEEPPPAQVKATPPKTAAKTTKYTMSFSSKGTKIPAAFNKGKVTAYLGKKLNGDKTCIPGSLKKKDVKPFVATVSVAKDGGITKVDIKPKLPQAKAISGCIKKKLSGNKALFKGKSANKITVSIKAK
ncbi:MAG: hypothetical protein KF799_12375 [Bdellovibrionales bacterium]|nr:hypothetical protein [Bdellovibrionales bacterium]